MDCTCEISATCKTHGISAEMKRIVTISKKISDLSDAGEIDAHIAMSLYQYNVRSGDRAAKIYEHFNGACAEMNDLLPWVESRFWATEMPLPTAKIYLQHALERYGAEAREQRRINEMSL